MMEGPEVNLFEVYDESTEPTERYAPEATGKKPVRSATNQEIDLWDQLDGESSFAYSAFLTFVNLGPSRTLLDAFRLYRNKPDSKQVDGGWNRWKAQFQWVVRANAYDAWYRQRNLKQQEEIILNTMQKRTERAGALRDRMFNMGDALIEKAEKMLAFPLEEVSRASIQDGKTVVVTIKPIRWTLSDIATLVNLAEKLRQLGMRSDEAPQLLRAEDIIEQMADAEGLTSDQKAAAIAQIKSLTAEPKTGRSYGN